VPPVDRRNPIRARSSESSCSLMEFMREFPDDDACLQWLWRNRYAPDGEHARCGRCDTERVFRALRDGRPLPGVVLPDLRLADQAVGGDDLRALVHVAASVVSTRSS